MPQFRVKLIPKPSHKGIHSTRTTMVDADNYFLAKDLAEGLYPDYSVYVDQNSATPVAVSAEKNARTAEGLNDLGFVIGQGAALLAVGAVKLGVGAFKAARKLAKPKE